MPFVNIADKFILGNMNSKVNMGKDGRKNNEVRPVKFTKDFTTTARGSVLFEFGDTQVITTASVEMKQPNGWIKTRQKAG